jgi:predicted ABC-type sugar transport system permease subunit
MILLGRTCAPALLAMLVAVATPASATATMECIGVEDPEVHVTLTLGSVPVLAVVNATITTPSAAYAMVPNPEQIAIIVGQGLSTSDGMSVDFADPNLLGILVTLRTMQAYRDRHAAHVGLLVVEDRDVYAVTCES